MRFPRPQPRLRRDLKRRPAAPEIAPSPVAPVDAPVDVLIAREPDDEHARADAPEAGFRASSYDLKRGLDVVELPTSLPPDVLDRLFKSPRR